MKEIPIVIIGGIPMVYVKLWSRSSKSYKTILLTLDTGAAVTTISREIFGFLGYSMHTANKKRIITASGPEYVDTVILDKVMLANFEYNDVEVYAHTFPIESFSIGVVGMDILSSYDLFISFQQKFLRLSPISDY